MFVSRAFSFASCWCILLFALPPIVPAAEDEPTGPELIREVRQAEQWAREVNTFHAKFERRSTKSERGIAARRKELGSRFPDSKITAARHPGLRPETTGTLEVAFDHENQRLSQRKDSDTQRYHVAWDGERLTTYRRYLTHEQQGHVLDDTVKQNFGEFFLLDIGWLRASPYNFWWDKHTMPMDYHRKAEEHKAAGREEFNGTECYVVLTTYERHGHPRRYYVSVDNHRLRGLEYGSFGPPRNAALQAMNEVAANYGRSFDDPEAAKTWLESLAKPRRKKLEERLGRKLWGQQRPIFRFTYSDYKEVDDGRWFPMTQGYVNYSKAEDGEVYAEYRSVHKATEVRVDEPLADELFEIEMRQGVEVMDYRWDPPVGFIHYKYDPDRTEEEFKQLVNQARKREAERDSKRQAQKELIGEPAPAFAEDAAWLNSEGLSWDKLRGKVVLIDFWATWCGPCRNDIPLLRKLHDEREDKGVVVIGAHTPDGDPAEVLKFMKKFNIEYPVYIDEKAKQPADDPWFLGRLFTGSRIWAIPHSMVVDREGNIAAHGSLQEVIHKANELAKQPDKQVN